MLERRHVVVVGDLPLRVPDALEEERAVPLEGLQLPGERKGLLLLQHRMVGNHGKLSYNTRLCCNEMSCFKDVLAQGEHIHPSMIEPYIS